MNIKTIQPAVEKAVKESGAIVLSYFNTALEKHNKVDGSYATDADVASEQYLLKALAKIMPEAGFYAEESGVSNPSKYMWVIDPLDGTTNFAQGIPYFCVSVALTCDDERVLGVIFQPCTGELFSAVKGLGATLNGKTIRVSNQQDFSKAVIGCSLMHTVNERFYNMITELEPKIYSVRIMGASALDMAYCAAGRFEGVFFGELCWWDIAAGSLIIEEAGGKSATRAQGALTNEARSLIAGPELIYEQLCSVIKP